MERGRYTMSRSASGIEGIQDIHRQKSVPRLSSDSCPSDGSTTKDMFVLDLGKSLLGQATGTPMKKLLAEEMSKEIESIRRSPSVIARLMGLEGSASPKHVSRQQKKPSASYEQKHAAVNMQRYNKYDSLSTGRSSEDLQSFKDVYEDLEASHLADRCCSKRWRAGSALTKDERAFIQQKFIDAKRSSAYLKLQRSKSNSEESFPHSSSSLDNHIAVLKPSSCKHKVNSKAHFHSETSSRQELPSHLKRKDGRLLEPHNHKGDLTSHKSSNIEESGEDKILLRRIVILKPNKMQNARISGLSPDQIHYLKNIDEKKGSPSYGLVETASFRKKDSSCSVMSQDAREIASRIVGRIREEYEETIDIKSISLRGGYAGDESSYDASESDTDCDSNMSKFVSEKSFADGKFHRYSSSQVAESPVNREAKQRLSERWKMTQRYQDLEMVSRGSTFGEMLAKPESETIAKPLAAKMNHENGWETDFSPCGISSRDGWKDELGRTSSRSISVPLSVSGKRHKRSIHHDKSTEDEYLLCSDPIGSDSGKVVTRNLFHGGRFSSNDLNSNCRNPLPYDQHLFTNEKDIILKSDPYIDTEAKVKSLHVELPFFQAADKDVTCRCAVFDVKMSAAHGIKTLSSKSPALLPEGLSLVANENKPHDSGNSSLQNVEGQSNPPKNSNEENHASPVSILEVPFSEDASSSSESFERVGAELSELRMQLNLLKMESGTYTEVSSLIPTENEIVFGGNRAFGGAEVWETSYALDIVQESGLEDSMLDMYRTKWHSPDCPLDVKLFDELENKYSETTCLSSERRLVFDRTNEVLMEIFEENIDLFPWVQPKLAGFNSASPTGVGLVLKLISHEDPCGVSSEDALDTDMQWLNSKQEIDAIGNDIEKMLIEDMIIELLLVL